ncbi:MAG: kynureninase [Caulobacteraceae bacterium]|nr:kynureninase [Caulobacteraceae bacterium]
MSLSLDDARRLDGADPLRGFRDRFVLPDGVIYLDGNSLGALPATTAARLGSAVTEEWGQGLIRSWNSHDWIGAPARVGAKIARMIGADPHEVVVADSTSVNLFKLIVAAVRRQTGRGVIVSEPGNFPTDLYVAQGASALLDGVSLRVRPADQIIEEIDADVALVMLTHVHYKTGARHDMAAITARAHEKGALILWDLSHSAGAVEVDLNAAGADLAVGCGYKYLNGGPGAPAFLFVAERLQAALQSPLTGWMGHAEPFQFGDDYRPAPGVARFLCGTPSVLALLALEVGVDLFNEASMATVSEKSQRLCSMFIDLVEDRCAGFGLQLVTPRDPAVRGSHVSFAHPDSYPIMQAMIERGVIGDFRAPDVLRCGFTPLYVGYEDVWRAVEIIHDILASGAWRDERFRTRSRVT